LQPRSARASAGHGAHDAPGQLAGPPDAQRAGGGGMARGRGLGCARWQVGWGAGHTSKRAGQAAVAGERLGAR
jgi:hypothetical protein